jgi:hypothetical protein
MKKLRKVVFLLAFVVFTMSCGINSVTKEQLEKVKPGDVLVYRYKKPDGKTWFYADKVTRIEGDKVYYNPSKSEATAGNDSRIGEFVTDKELSINKDELLKYATEQGEEKKVIIWIK